MTPPDSSDEWWIWDAGATADEVDPQQPHGRSNVCSGGIDLLQRPGLTASPGAVTARQESEEGVVDVKKSVTNQSLAQNQDNTTPPSQPGSTDAELRELAIIPRRPGRPRDEAFYADATSLLLKAFRNRDVICAMRIARELAPEYGLTVDAARMRIVRLLNKWQADR